MSYDTSNIKRIVYIIIFFCLIFPTCFSFNARVAFCENTDDVEEQIDDNVEKILDEINVDQFDIDLNEYDYFNIFNKFSVVDFIKEIISGNFSIDINSFFDVFIERVKTIFLDYYSLILLLLFIIILYEVFYCFCPEKYKEIKNIVFTFFNFEICLILLLLLKNFIENISDIINNTFTFGEKFFPVILTLVMLSGATKTFSVGSSLSVFVLNSGTYIFKFILFPLATSVAILSITSKLVTNKNLSKLSSIFSSFFKIIISIFFTIFGLFSIINLIISGANDGLSLKITKYAIKNYIPILGGYISEGFDYIKSCSVLVKNGFGIFCIVLIFFMILKPIIQILVLYIVFKILSFLSSFIGNEMFSNLFLDFSKSFIYFLVILLCLFLIIFVYIILMMVSVSLI